MISRGSYVLWHTAPAKQHNKRGGNTAGTTQTQAQSPDRVQWELIIVSSNLLMSECLLYCPLIPRTIECINSSQHVSQGSQKDLTVISPGSPDLSDHVQIWCGDDGSSECYLRKLKYLPEYSISLWLTDCSNNKLKYFHIHWRQSSKSLPGRPRDGNGLHPQLQNQHFLLLN